MCPLHTLCFMNDDDDDDEDDDEDDDDDDDEDDDDDDDDDDDAQEQFWFELGIFLSLNRFRRTPSAGGSPCCHPLGLGRPSYLWG